MLYECERERECVRVSVVVYLHKIALARSSGQCVHIRFIVEKKREKEKKMQKDIEYLLIFYFSRFSFCVSKVFLHSRCRREEKT
jgi:hypothetical protein